MTLARVKPTFRSSYMTDPRKVLIEVDPLLWQEVRDYAEREGRTLKWVVSYALDRLIRGRSGAILPQESPETVTERVNAALAAKGLGGIKTAKQLIEEREAQRGDESNQDRYPDDDHTF